MTAIWYIHGFGASAISFSWMQAQLPLQYTARFFTYPMYESVDSCIHRLKEMLTAHNEPAILVGHSLGGVIARACCTSPTARKIVTLCAPFGGIPGAGLLSFFRTPPAFSDLRRHGPLLTKLRSEPTSVPHLAIVSSNGMPVMNTPNDGVVTLDSQTALALDQHYRHFGLNHYEVLLSPDVALTITEFLTAELP